MRASSADYFSIVALSSLQPLEDQLGSWLKQEGKSLPEVLGTTQQSLVLVLPVPFTIRASVGGTVTRLVDNFFNLSGTDCTQTAGLR